MASAAQPLWPFLLPVAGFVTYSLVLKTVRAELHPLLFLGMAYGFALLLAGLIYLIFGNLGDKAVQPKDIMWAALLGASLVTIEFGILLTLRNGWPVGTSITAINVATAILLLLIGMVAFRERLSITNIAGAVLCIGGLLLITKK